MTVGVVDASVVEWPDIEERFGWNGLLLGNGASCAVSSKFKCNSLYEEACRTSDPLLPLGAQAVFDALDTRNFEVVLRALRTSGLVNTCLQIVEATIGLTYEQVRDALISAVDARHVTWTEFSPVREAVHRELRRYSWVFTTNYDLLVYWAIMFDKTDFRDFFWSNPFDLTDTDVWGKATCVVFRHGALHLEMQGDGGAYKRVSEGLVGDLLSTFGESQDAVPLFVSEGHWKDKMRAIRSSDYLSFAYSRLVEHRGPLVIFGHGLGRDEDNHIVRAIGASASEPIAVSVYNTDEGDVIARKANLRQRLPGKELLFFRAVSHPLGKSDLCVDPRREPWAW